MKKLVMCITMMFAFSLVTNAQSVQRQGNTFTQVSNKGGKSEGKEIKTQYTYKDSKGVEYPIYLSSTERPSLKGYLRRLVRNTNSMFLR